MAFGNKTDWHRDVLPKPEILKYPLNTPVIDSGVLNGSGVAADTSGPYKGRRYLLAGTILSKRTDSQYERFTGAGGQAVAGVLFDTVEVPDATEASDTPIAFVRRNVEFDKTKIVDFVTHETVLKTALATCEFS